MIKVYTILKLHITDEKLRKYKQERDNKKYYYDYAKVYSSKIKNKRGMKKYYNDLNKCIRKGAKKGILKNDKTCISNSGTV